MTHVFAVLVLFMSAAIFIDAVILFDVVPKAMHWLRKKADSPDFLRITNKVVDDCRTGGACIGTVLAFFGAGTDGAVLSVVFTVVFYVVCVALSEALQKRIDTLREVQRRQDWRD